VASPEASGGDANVSTGRFRRIEGTAFDPDGRRRKRRLRVLPAWAWLVGLVAVSSALRYWAASRVPIPWILPDETIYAELGKSLYETGRLEILGEPTRFYGLVTPALAGLPLTTGDIEDGYRVLKALQAVVVSLAAVPAFLWARTLASEAWALAAAALTLAIPDLAYSGLIMTEVAFYPAVVLAAWAMAVALVRPTIALQAAVVGTILLAAATRLQAVVLVPAFAAALLVYLASERRLRSVVRYWPTAASLAVFGVAWAALRLRGGAPATELLGAYRAAGEVDYGFADALRFVLYHAADVVLFTGLIPVCAVAVLALVPDKPARIRAYLAVTVAVAVSMTILVGVFASRHVGHLAERNLFALAPLFFVGLAAWLGAGGSRPRPATALIALAAAYLLLWLPLGPLVSVATIVDGFTLIPLYRLDVRVSEIDLDLVVAVVAAATAAAFAFLPRRLLWTLPLVLGLAFAAASVSASRVVAARATLGQPGSVGANPDWVDEAGAGPAAYLYTGDVFWTSVWETVFWNRRVRRVYDLLEAQVPGPLPQPSLGPYEDGRLVDKTGAEVRIGHVVASDSLRFVGRRIANAGNSISLWSVEPPLRLAQWTQNVRFDRTIDGQARVIVYACRGGRLQLRLRAPEPRSVELRRNERTFVRRSLAAGETWRLDVAAVAPRPVGTRLCSFDVMTDGSVLAARLFYSPPAD
jgi:hypothetical protein